MKKMFKILFLVLLLLIPMVSNAQEPKNNLGKSLGQLRQNFPNLRYVET